MRNRRKRTGWKADLLWFLLFAALAQVGLILFIDWRRPQLHDLEYGARVALLRARRAEAPEQPLCLVVGSSRAALAFLPEELPPLRSASGELVLPFNFSHLGGGPVIDLMELRRLLREGIRPRWVVLEVMPTLMEQQRTALAEGLSVAPDLPLLLRYVNPVKLWAVYLRRRLNPWYTNRLGILREYAPCWASDAGGEDRMTFGPLGGGGWQETVVDPETKRRRVAAVRALYRNDLQHFHIDAVPDQALRESLELCRREGIACALLVTPESDEYRSWYSAGGLECFDRYCAGVGEEYDVPVVDASRWLPDDQFGDATHLIRPGAEAFTERLGREMLRPLVEGRLRRQGPEQ